MDQRAVAAKARHLRSAFKRRLLFRDQINNVQATILDESLNVDIEELENERMQMKRRIWGENIPESYYEFPEEENFDHTNQGVPFLGHDDDNQGVENVALAHGEIEDFGVNDVQPQEQIDMFDDQELDADVEHLENAGRQIDNEVVGVIDQIPRQELDVDVERLENAGPQTDDIAHIAGKTVGTKNFGGGKQPQPQPDAEDK